MDQPSDAGGPIARLEAPNCRRVSVKVRAPSAVVIFPVTANCTKPGRRASLRLIVTVSHGSMGGRFYSTVRGSAL